MMSSIKKFFFLFHRNGDKLGAAAAQDRLDKTIAAAKGLEATAKADYATAETARKSIPEYQYAAQTAANRVLWEYKNAFK